MSDDQWWYKTNVYGYPFDSYTKNSGKLHKIELINYVLNDNGNDNIFKSSLGIFNLKFWITAVVPGKDPISPYKSENFYVF